MNWYLKVLKENYANFSGRAQRTEFWWFILVSLIVSAIALAVDRLIGLDFPPVFTISILAVFVPFLAVSVRRLHDVGKSGWMSLINLIPGIGSIFLFMFFCMDSVPEDNEYGPNSQEKPLPVSPSVKRFFFFTLSLLCFVLFLLQWSPLADAERDWKPVFEYIGFLNKVDYLTIPQHFWTSILAGFAITFFASAVAHGDHDIDEEF